ncbi:MAG TPA: thiamine pyrophosphate-dependent enzyme, partial [Polyangiaceae bacterium]|nr:thiamine pyrophosphate-dependent enzyme [Polyangiaceae bacterium]
PAGGFVHVDLDPSVFGAAYPHARTLGIPAEIGGFLRGLLEAWPSGLQPRLAASGVRPFPAAPSPRPGRVRPSYLASVVQSQIVARTDSIVLTEAGNAFAIGSHYLSFDGPRYRVSSGFGSMGQASAGVLGAALGSRRKAVALVGDGALLMLNEINTAATYGIDAVWIVLNDAGYRMIAQGMQAVGWQTFETEFTRADFVSIARAMGGDGVRVEREEDVTAALQTALAAHGPFVVDVIVDPEERAPSGNRNQSLLRQGLSA